MIRILITDRYNSNRYWNHFSPTVPWPPPLSISFHHQQHPPSFRYLPPTRTPLPTCYHLPSTMTRWLHYASTASTIPACSSPSAHSGEPTTMQNDREELLIDCSRDGKERVLLAWEYSLEGPAGSGPNWWNIQPEEGRVLLAWQQYTEMWQLSEQSDISQRG